MNNVGMCNWTHCIELDFIKVGLTDAPLLDLAEARTIIASDGQAASFGMDKLRSWASISVRHQCARMLGLEIR